MPCHEAETYPVLLLLSLSLFVTFESKYALCSKLTWPAMTRARMTGGRNEIVCAQSVTSRLKFQFGN